MDKRQVDLHSHLPNLRVHIEALTRGGLMYPLGGQHHLLSRFILGTVLTVGTVGRAYTPWTGEEMRSF